MSDTLTHYRHTDPHASRIAAARAAYGARDNTDLCLRAHVDAGERGLTGDELAAATGVAYQAIGPRRPGLERDGLLEKVRGEDGRQLRRGGKGVYRATADGRARGTA